MVDVESIFIAGNRGPCGGVNMALQAAEAVLGIVGGREPVFTPWDIVHNTPIMSELARKGLVNFGLDWDKVPDRSIVLKPAHGGPPSLDQIAADKGCLLIDVTCPLVARVQDMALRAQEDGQDVIYIGALNHPEPAGVLGRLDPTRAHFIQTLEDFQNLRLPEGRRAVVLSQTTMGKSDVGTIEAQARLRPNIRVPDRSSICYATDTRQNAVTAMLEQQQIDRLVVVGSPHSHNSQELVGLGRKSGIPSTSIDTVEEMSAAWDKLNAAQSNLQPRVGLTSGASVPDRLLIPVIDWLARKYPNAAIEWLAQITPEADRTFRLPENAIRQLRERYN